MLDPIQSLGDAVRKARIELAMTQGELAEAIDVDVRTVSNIENHKGNPKYEVLFPLIRKLGIDPREVFYPDVHTGTAEKQKLLALVDSCSAEETELLIQTIRPLLQVLRNRNSINIE